jgi:hypothetical protein
MEPLSALAFHVGGGVVVLCGGERGGCKTANQLSSSARRGEQQRVNANSNFAGQDRDDGKVVYGGESRQ